MSSKSVRRRKHWLWLAGAVVLFLFSVTLIGLAIDAVTIPSSYEKTDGTVVEGGDDAVIRFEDHDHREYEFTSFAEGEQGETMVVYFDPADPVATAFTDVGRSNLIWGGFVSGAILGSVAVWMSNRWRGLPVDIP